MIREQRKDQSKQWYDCADTLNNRNVKINLCIIVFIHPASDMNSRTRFKEVKGLSNTHTKKAEI